jgi:hypothetical protein
MSLEGSMFNWSKDYVQENERGEVKDESLQALPLAQSDQHCFWTGKWRCPKTTELRSWQPRTNVCIFMLFIGVSDNLSEDVAHTHYEVCT